MNALDINRGLTLTNLMCIHLKVILNDFIGHQIILQIQNPSAFLTPLIYLVKIRLFMDRMILTCLS